MYAICMTHSEWGGSFWRVEGRAHALTRSDTFLLLRHSRRPTGVAVELGRLWFVRCKRAIRGPVLGYSGSAAVYNQNSFVR